MINIMRWLMLSWLMVTPIYADEMPLLAVQVDIQNQATLQRGAKLFMNYCSGCHSLRYMRYNQMAKDLGLTTFTGDVDSNLLKNNLIFTQALIHDPIRISMPEVDARQWFGRMPPDLSLVARKYSPSWIYTYLKSFYDDPQRPFGANNLLVPDVAMPNIFAHQSGIKVVYNNHLITMVDGEMTAQQFDAMLVDLVTFLTYVAEPVKTTRQHIGIYVMLFLLVAFVVVYWLRIIQLRKITLSKSLHH
jgi:ubiquinol-cytochrome c reductase cytochrome c1 subunit